MKTTTTTIIGIAALALAGLSADAFAQPGGPRGGGPGRGLAALGISPEQRQQIDQLRQAAWKQSEPLRAQMDAKQAELRQLWQTDRPDKAAIVSKQGELDALRAQQQSISVDFRLQVHALLTPEQRTKWAEQAGPGLGGGFGRGHGRGFMHGPGFGRGQGPGPRGMGNPDCPLRAQ
jgi:Spy/CpxP family protein refolding chaperone